jgi:hypothetical protein
MLGPIQKQIIRNAIKNNNRIVLSDLSIMYGRKSNFNLSASSKSRTEWNKWLNLGYIVKIDNHYEVTELVINQVISKKEETTMKEKKCAENENKRDLFDTYEYDPYIKIMNKQMQDMM